MKIMRDEHCQLSEIDLGNGIRALVLVNKQLRITILPDKGADIYSIVFLPHEIDLLWKSPQGLRPPNYGLLSSDSSAAWLEQYEGGWQEIFPNGGDACLYNGAPLNFHGESTMLPWRWKVIENAEYRLIVEFTVRLFRSPLELTRRITVNAGSSAFSIAEQITNWSRLPTALMWGHHPAYGAPFLGKDTRLYTNARVIVADPTYDPPYNPLRPGDRSHWPLAVGKDGHMVDLSRMPGPADRRDMLAYLFDFDGSPWYALVNPEKHIGLGMTWDSQVFKYLWLWQEVHATEGFPWYGEAYTVAVEPWSSYPGSGLVNVINTTQTQLVLAGGESITSTLTFSCFDVPDNGSIPSAITTEGDVKF